MKQLRLFGIDTLSRSENVTAQSRVNMYLEFSKHADKTKVVAYGTPGLTLFANMGSAVVIRGMYAVGVYLYVVVDQRLYRVNQAGDAEELGTLSTDGSIRRVGMADNGLQLMITDGIYGYIYTYATEAFVEITDADFIAPGSVSFNDGFFIVSETESGRFWLSATYNGLSWNALDFATAESNPEDLVYAYADHGELILLGELTTEFWINSGSLNFPYTRISGAAIEWGIAAKWTVAKFDNSLVWLAKNRLGEVQVVRLAGYSPQRISTFDIENIINSYRNISTASAFSYMYNGHPFYQINFNEGSWLYDGASQIWSQLKGYEIDRHRAEFGTLFGSRIVVADYENGNIYEISESAYTDNGDPIISQIITPHTIDAGERIVINEIQVEFGTGTAAATDTEPVMSLQVSKDGGHTFGAEKYATMGNTGEYKKRCRWLRLGQARDWVFKITISSPVYRAILGAWYR